MFRLTVLSLIVTLPAWAQAAPCPVVIEQSAQVIDIYDLVEVTLRVTQPPARNPFVDVAVAGEFRQENGVS
jgi:hypothetical protein